MALTPPGATQIDRCTCWFFTTFSVEFTYFNIVCPPGVAPPAGTATYINGGDLWPGRFIHGSALSLAAQAYLRNVAVPTHAGFDFDNFLVAMGNVPPDCTGSDQV